MDSDNCDVIIKVLSNVLNRLIDVNKSHTGQQLITKFQSSYPPEVSIHAYLERIKKYARCSDSCFVVALIYIDRMIEVRNVVLTSLNVHRLIITSLMLAAKFFDDLFYNNAFYAKLGGVAPLEMNALELEFLQLLNYSLFVTPDVYTKYYSELRNYVGIVDIPVYLSSSYPNSPTTSEKVSNSRPPSTSPFDALLDISRFPTPPLLETTQSQQHYHELLLHNKSINQPLENDTHISSSMHPYEGEEIAPGPFYPTQGPIGQGVGPFNILRGHYSVSMGNMPITMPNQYYPSDQAQGGMAHAYYEYDKAYPTDPSATNEIQREIVDRQGHAQFDVKWFDHLSSYNLYNRQFPGTNTQPPQCPAPMNCHHQTLQMMSSCPYNNQLELERAYMKKEMLAHPQTRSQDQCCPPPFPTQIPHPHFVGPGAGPGVAGPHLTNLRSRRGDCQAGLSPLDFIRTSTINSGINSNDTSGSVDGRNAFQPFNGHRACSSSSDEVYRHHSEHTSLSSFSDDFNSGATTPNTDGSGSHSQCSSRSSLGNLLSLSSDGSLCSSNVSQIFSSQTSSHQYQTEPGRPYYSQPLQQPHYIIA